MKKQLFLLLMMLSPVVTMAYDAEIDGIYYNFNGTEATVTSGDNKYSGDIVIPETVTYNEMEYPVVCIGVHAFSQSDDLTSVTIANSVTTIETYAFIGSSNLTSVTIPNSVTSIMGNVFQGCELTAIVVEEGNTKYDSRNNCNAIIETSSNTLITGCKNSTIPNTVTCIGRSAFSSCRGLNSITIPNSVITIEDYAFAYCRALNSITIPNSVKTIGHSILSDCSDLTEIIVENDNTVYDSRNNCNAIIETSSNTLISGCKNSTIPNTVTSIGRSAFSSCRGLITIPNSVTTIGDYAFGGNNLTSIIIGKGVMNIGYFAFGNCSSLTDVYCYAETVPSTDNDAFVDTPIGNIILHVHAASIDAYKMTKPWSDFKEIVSLNIEFADANVKEICVANWDTNGDGELSEVEAAAVTSLGGVFTDNSQITSFDELQYFTGLNRIESEAFRGCSSLSSIEIPNNVTSIGQSVFEGCTGLISVNIPNSVTSIWKYAFVDCI